MRSRAVEALPGVEYLGLAAVMGDDSFVDLHRAEVRQAFADSPVARARLQGFRQELQRLLGAVDEGSRGVIISWLKVVDLVFEVDGHC